ncbi:MAG: response regulator [Phycisphaerae bacterium]|nr:response regulator [Phycisphaerae bacterium]
MPTEPIRVLIVDDEERFRETTAAILKRRGFDVRAVGSGIDAIDEVKKDAIDVVVLDVKMPGIDGHTALREIRKIKPNLAVLMLTGHGTPRSALEGLQDGVFDYLTKPCAVDVLAQKIREAYEGTAEGKAGLRAGEPRASDIMVPLASFSSVHEDSTVAEAVDVLLRSFTRTMTTSTVSETVHRSVLVLDDRERVVGIITFTDLLQALQPPYMRILNEDPVVSASRFLEAPSFSGMFTIMSRDLGKQTVREIMSEAPPLIRPDANLMEIASALLNKNLRRLLVTENDDVIGVVREQDLIFEMAKHMKNLGSERI